MVLKQFFHQKISIIREIQTIIHRNENLCRWHLDTEEVQSFPVDDGQLGFPEGKTHASTIPFKFLNIFFERKLTHDFPYLLLYSCKADSYACSNVSPRLRIQAVIRHLHARF